MILAEEAGSFLIWRVSRWGTIAGRWMSVGTYVWSQDIVGEGRLVDGGVLVRLEVDQSVLRDALSSGFFCTAETTTRVSASRVACA